MNDGSAAFAMNDGSAVFAGVSALMVLIPVLALAVIVGMVVYSVRRTKQRLAMLGQWAATTGWVLVPRDRDLPLRWNKYPFGVGDSRVAAEILYGTWSGSSAISLTYRFTTGSGRDRTSHVYHVVTLSLPAYLPELTITRDGLGAKLAKLVGGQDLHFESDDFNRTWRVEAAEPKYGYDVITPRLMERLLQPDAVQLGLRIDGTDVMCWAVGATPIEELAPRLEVLAAIRAAVPTFVWRDHGYDPGNG